jgi:hypothetical protein
MKIEGHPYEFRIIGRDGDRAETSSGQVPMAHGETYKFRLRSNVRSSAKIMVDGVSVGEFVVPAHRDVIIERPADAAQLFTFFAVDTAEARASMQDGISGINRGLIEITFTPERMRPAVVSSSQGTMRSLGGTKGLSVGELSCQSFGAGVTGLTGQSSQNFTNVHMDLDHSQSVTLRVRLVHDEARQVAPTVRPLSGHLPRETPIPPVAG